VGSLQSKGGEPDRLVARYLWAIAIAVLSAIALLVLLGRWGAIAPMLPAPSKKGSCAADWRHTFGEEAIYCALRGEPPLATPQYDGDLLAFAEAVAEYVSEAVEYVEEAEEYVQKPSETLARGEGDCEDIALLTAWLLLQKLDVAYVLVLEFSDGSRHAEAAVEVGGRLYAVSPVGVRALETDYCGYWLYLRGKPLSKVLVYGIEKREGDLEVELVREISPFSCRAEVQDLGPLLESVEEELLRELGLERLEALKPYALGYLEKLEGGEYAGPAHSPRGLCVEIVGAVVPVDWFEPRPLREIAGEILEILEIPPDYRYGWVEVEQSYRRSEGVEIRVLLVAVALAREC